MDESGEVTRLLGEIGRGQKDAMNQLLPLVYDELHRLARSYFRRERGEHTLQATALVNEAYIRLVDQKAPLQSHGHFLAVAATQMRRILLDYARKHRAARRGGAGQKVILEDTMAICEQQPVDMIALDSALTRLGALDPEQARMVELRFFGGLSVEQTAAVMNCSPATVKRSWSSARAFLHREMTGGSLDAGALGADSADL
jgi:RNA polymerase sigma-70 factor (ECF subfamily)